MQPTVVQFSELQSKTLDSQLRPSQVEEACKQAGATIQAFGQATWALLLAAYLGEPSVTFGTIFSTQSAPNVDPPAFPSITTVPVVCNTNEFDEKIIQSMVSYNGSAQRHRFASLADIQRFAGSADRRLFDTVFVYQKSASSKARKFSWPILQETAAVDYAASLELEFTPHDTIQLRLTVDSGRIPETHTELMLKQYDHILGRLVEQRRTPRSPYMDIYSMAPARDPELPSTVKLLHRFVEERARQEPDSPALEFVYRLYDAKVERKTWSYRQLDEAGNQVARLVLQKRVKTLSLIHI